MTRSGLLIGEVAAKSGVSRKALRLYERAGILPPARRGLHMGLTQGLLATMVTDTAPAALRGTAFGAFNLAAGIAIFAASVLAGLLWDRFGPAGTFTAGAFFSLISLVGFALVGRQRRR